MKKITTLLFILVFSLGQLFAQTTISGVKLPAKLGFGGTIRELNGAGVRTKYFVKVYVGALYLKEKSKDAQAIIDADKPMSIRLQIISSMLTNDVMVKYIREGFSRSLNGKIEPYKEHIDLICEVFSSEPTKVGDVYDIHYTPGVGVSASKNGKPYIFKNLKNKLGKPYAITLKYTKNGQDALPGIGFKKGLFGIWLSKDPVDAKLKEGMLGL